MVLWFQGGSASCLPALDLPHDIRPQIVLMRAADDVARAIWDPSGVTETLEVEVIVWLVLEGQVPRLAPQLGPVTLFHRRIERIHVHVQDRHGVIGHGMRLLSRERVRLRYATGRFGGYHLRQTATYFGDASSLMKAITSSKTLSHPTTCLFTSP